jgi:hypothetical protein
MATNPIPVSKLVLTTERTPTETIVHCTGKITSDTAQLLKTTVKPLFSERRVDHYSAFFIDPITNTDVLIVSTDVDHFPQPKTSPSTHSRDLLTGENVTVRQADAGSYYLLDVSFVIPDVCDLKFDTIEIYGMQIIGKQRSHDLAYPSVHGSWQPKEKVEFSVRVLKEYADPSLGWNLTFCVGSTAGCYPSSNLLTLITQNGK